MSKQNKTKSVTEMYLHLLLEESLKEENIGFKTVTTCQDSKVANGCNFCISGNANNGSKQLFYHQFGYLLGFQNGLAQYELDTSLKLQNDEGINISVKSISTGYFMEGNENGKECTQGLLKKMKKDILKDPKDVSKFVKNFMTMGSKYL